MILLLENLDKACEMTVFTHPKAPGIAVVPPCTQLHTNQNEIIKEPNKNNIREQGIQNALTSEKRKVSSLLLRNRSRCTDWPKLHHGMLCRLAFKLCLEYSIADRIATLLSDMCDRSARARREHNLMIVDKRVLVNTTKDVSSRYVVAY